MHKKTATSKAETPFMRLKQSLPSLLLLISILCIISGLTGIAYINQDQTSQNFDIRQQASTNTPQSPPVITSPQANTTIQNTTSGKKEIIFKMSDENISQAQVYATFTSAAISNLEIKVNNPVYTVQSSEIEAIKDGYLAKLIVNRDPNVSAFAASDTFFTLQFDSSRPDKVYVAFDRERSIATIQNNKVYINASSFSVTLDSLVASPTPSARPTATPLMSCNQTCSTHAQCPSNHLCYDTGSDKRCRLVTNPSSTTCSASATSTGLNRQCNQYCADTSECASGFTCWSNRCRRPDNIESTSCSALSSTTAQTIAQSCNKSCSSNAECAINMRCSSGQCRLAANPSSSSCSAQNAPVISQDYTKGGSESAQPAPSVTPIAVATPNIMPSPTPASTSTGSTSARSLIQMLNDRFGDSWFAVGLIFLGIAAFALFLLLLALRKLRRNRRPPMATPTSPSPNQDKPATQPPAVPLQSRQIPVPPRPTTSFHSPPPRPPSAPQSVSQPHLETQAARPAGTMIHTVKEKNIKLPQ